jgi:hypothetical protein
MSAISARKCFTPSLHPWVPGSRSAPRKTRLCGDGCRAYLALSLASETEDGSCTMSLARFGAFEVRLIELARRPMTEDSDFWIELYRQDTQSSVDSCRCQDLDEAEPIADYSPVQRDWLSHGTHVYPRYPTQMIF